VTEAQGTARAEVEPRVRNVRRRWDLLVFVGVLMGPAMVVSAAIVASQDTRQLEESLVRDAEASLAGPFPRPVHVTSPQPGTLGEALAAHLPAVEAVSKQLETQRDSLYAVAAGTATEESLSPALRQSLERIGPDVNGILIGTRSATADLPPGREAYVPVSGTTWAAAQFAAVVAAIRVRRELEEGQTVAALDTCLDALALGRDAGIAGGLVGRMSGVAITGRVFPACEAAIRSTARPEAPAALARLRLIRDAQPGPADILRVEFRSIGLFTFAPLLSEEDKARLGPVARSILKDGDRPFSLWERVYLRYSWPAMHRHEEALVRAAAAGPAEREASIKAVEAQAKHWMNPLMHLLPSHLRFLQRAEAATRRLDALVFILAARSFRDLHGRWPGDVRELSAAGLLTPAEEDRCRAARLDVDEAGALRVTVPLPQADPEKDDPELSVRVDAA